MGEKRKTPRPPPQPFYLGNRDTAKERLERLDNLAKKYGVTRSVLLQMIADGDIELPEPKMSQPKE